jgi:general secretion pathway protein G
VPKIQIKFGTDGWPPDLKSLVEGQPIIGDATGKKIRFLRRIPIDPMTNSTEWGLRSTQDDTDSTSWGGENVWDVYSKSQALSLDGVTHYNEW